MLSRTLLALCLLVTPVLAQQKPSAPLKTSSQQQIASAVSQMNAWLVTQRRDFHMHPELSNREERTAKVVADRLKQIGYTDVRTGIARHGVVTILKGGRPGPVVAVRADMDALPIQETNNVPYRSQNAGVKHACGHDVHTTVGLGVAEVLFKMRDQLPGTVKFIFQPAEEGAPEGEAGGAPQMVKEGVLDGPRPEAIFALHTEPKIEAGKIGYTQGPFMASSDSWYLTIRGKQTHGAYPHQGVDPIVVSAEVIEALQTIPSRKVRALDPVVVTVGKIQGGLRHNVIAPEVKMDGTLRTLDEDVRASVQKWMQQVIEGVTRAHGATFELTWTDKPNPVTVNETKLTQESLPSLAKVVGDANVVRMDPQMGAEDFAHFARIVPGFYYLLGVANQERGITAMTHTPDFDVDERSLEIGVKTMANVVVDYLQRHAGAASASR